MVEPNKLCDCTHEQCPTPYFNRLVHDGDECVHVDGKRHKLESRDLIQVRYKFQDDKEFITISVTEQQYLNLYDVSAIEKCEILGPALQPLSEKERDRFNQKILVVCREKSNISKYLLD